MTLLRRTLLSPLTVLYGAVLLMRHALYDFGFLKSARPAVPTIAIGNLALGGTGKTPMLELVLRTLEGKAPLATLSRGYGREERDIHEVRASDTAEQSGDEPVQVKRKFPGARVFVGADRVKAITHIERQVPGVQAVVLDDALQHRALDAGLNILLTTWQRPWHTDALLPAGRLRDLPSRAKAAQIVVVTKCPALPSEEEQRQWRARLGLREGQALFFSGIEYGELSVVGLKVEARLPDGQVEAVERLKVERPPSVMQPLNPSTPQPLNLLLVTGIADPQPLVEHLRRITKHTEHIAFPDHHPFSPADLARLAERYAKFAPSPKMLVTTEKDAARLGSVVAGSPLEGLPLATIGMRAVILNEPGRFAALIRDHVATHPAHR